MLQYSVKNPACNSEKFEPGYVYLFDEHDRWVNWAQNINERQRMNDQRDIHIYKNPRNY